MYSYQYVQCCCDHISPIPVLEHGFWASERLLTGSSRRTIQRVIVNFCIHPFASVPRRPYRTTGIYSLFAALPTSDRFSNTSYRGKHAFAGVHARRSITVPFPRNNGPGMAWRREALTANWNRALARPGTTHRRHPRPQPQVNNARAYRLRFRVSLRFKSCSYANRLFVLNADRPLSAPLEPQTRSQSHGYTAVRLDLSPSCHVR